MAWCLRACGNTTRLRSFFRVLPQFYSKFEVDVMDEFTSQLIQKRVEKWDNKKRKNEALLETALPKSEQKSFNPDIDKLGPDELRLLIQNFLDNADVNGVINITEVCIVHDKPPPLSTLFGVLSTCAQNGKKDLIHQLQEQCQTHHSDILRDNSNFRDFLAEAIWVKGDIMKALELFEEVYRENVHLRRRIRVMLKFLISDSVATGSGAALTNMINFCERIVRDFQDFFPLTCVWQACFLSEWFTDQSIALELLEKHHGMCKFVVNRLAYVVYISLKCHRTEVVYRLLEILLQYKMKTQYSSVLGALLEYQFRFGDLARCAEIINWAVDNEVSLPQRHIIQMINLILNEKMNTPLVPLERRKSSSKCDFKF